MSTASCAVTPSPIAALPRAVTEHVALGLGAPPRARVVVTEIDEAAALQVLRSGPTPVLAAGADADGLFRRAVVGVDFGPASTRAAALALRLLARGGTLSLVHVEPRLELGESAWDASDTRARSLAHGRLQRLAVELPHDERYPDGPWTERRDVMIGCVTLVGDPATELVEYAERVGADLVAVGAHGAEPATGTAVGAVVAQVVGLVRTRLAAASVVACRAG